MALPQQGAQADKPVNINVSIHDPIGRELTRVAARVHPLRALSNGRSRIALETPMGVEPTHAALQAAAFLSATTSTSYLMPDRLGVQEFRH